MAEHRASHGADRQASLERAASLARPLRRSLYDYVIAQPAAVGRDEAASALGISRALAAFHLDKLVRDGLLSVEYRRLSGRSGPGAGRPAKLYRRGPDAVEVALPERRYQLVAEVLAAAVESLGPQVAATVGITAETMGRRVAEASNGDGRSAAPPVDRLIGVFADVGFEPRLAPDGSIELRNCPFHGVRDDHQELVCGMNRCLVEGIVNGSRLTGFVASLEPDDGRCCVVVRPEDASGD